MGLSFDWSPAVVPALAVLARMAAAVAVGTLPFGPVVPLRVRGALALALVRDPATTAVAPRAISPPSWGSAMSTATCSSVPSQGISG